MSTLSPFAARFARNTSWSLFSRLINIATVLVTTPIIVNRLGPELMGVWLLVNQVVAYLALTGIGVPNSVARFLSKFYALEDHASATEFFTTAFVATCVAGLAVIALGIASATYIGELMKLHVEYHRAAAAVTIILGISTGVTLPLQLGQGLLAGLHRFDRIALWLTVSAVFRFALIIVAFTVEEEPSIVILAMIAAAANLLGFALMLWDGLRKSPDLKINLRVCSFSAFREISSLGIAALFITLAAMLTRQGSTVMVGRLLGPVAVTLFALPLMVLNYIMPILSIFQIQIYPVASGMAAIGKKDNLLRVYSSIVMLSISFILLTFLGSIFIGKELLAMWLMHGAITAGQVATMASILTIFLGSYAFAVPGIMGRAILESVGLHRKAAQFEITSALIGLGIGYLAIQFLKMDVMGMAVGISVAFVVRGGQIFYETARFFSRSTWSLLRATCLWPIVIFCSAGLAGGIAYLFVSSVAGAFYQWLSDLAGLVVAGAAWSVGTWLTVLEKSQRRRVLLAVGLA